MVQKFTLPAGLIGRFAVVKLWPEIKTAEDECIARLKITAVALGLECIEIHADGRLLDEPTRVITKQDVDFVLHLHYDTPKLYDAFSFVALWNPLQFYHGWGYQRCSRNLLSHDDFVSCSSTAADDHVARIVHRTATHLPPFFHLYHSIADLVYPPSLGEQKLFYAGINWEALGGRKKSRHGELLKRLDQTGELRIYGPTFFQGVEIWGGYDSYVREIPFDGFSMMDEIAKAGIALVLSSEAHKESELMSSRLFESIAAGALVICDENNFAQKFFGDSLLYIDTRCPVETICNDILTHLAWAKTNVNEALKMVAKAQEIFRQKFTMKQSLMDMYSGFSVRKHNLLVHQNPKSHAKINVRLNLLLPEYSETVLDKHIASVAAQEYESFSAVIIIDKVAASENRARIEETFSKSPVSIKIQEVDFFTYGLHHPEIKTRRKLGEVISEVLRQSSPVDAVVFVAPNEHIFSNHLQVLANSLIRNPDKNCAVTAVILMHGQMANQPVQSIYEKIDFRHFNSSQPIGYARFIFRVSTFSNNLHLALPYVDRKALAILIGDNVICQEIPSTVVIDTESEFPSGAWDEEQENTVVNDMFPTAFTVYKGVYGEENIFPHAFPAPKGIVGRIFNVFRLVLQLVRCWLIIQFRILRRDGLRARLRAMKRKIERKLVELKQIV